MTAIIPTLLSVFCFLFLLEMTTGPWKWWDRLRGIDDHPSEKEITQIQLNILLEQEDLSVKNDRVICNECQRESCGFCNNGRVIHQAQELLDKRNEL